MSAPLENAVVKAGEKLLSSVLNEAQVSQGPEGKRAWISRSREDLFPGRPDFQESEVTAVGVGWLLGTQMSAKLEMPARIEAACACVGLVFRRDLEADSLIVFRNYKFDP